MLAVAFPKSEALVLSPLPYTPDQALAGLVQSPQHGNRFGRLHDDRNGLRARATTRAPERVSLQHAFDQAYPKLGVPTMQRGARCGSPGNGPAHPDVRIQETNAIPGSHSSTPVTMKTG